MKLFLVLALCFVAVLGETEYEIWLRYNRRMPVGYHTMQPIERPAYNGRIVGGVDANIADYPYQLSLRRSGSHSCGASVLTVRWALSAAHCTFPVPVLSTISLLGGSSSRLTGGVIFEVDDIINHPQYDDLNLENDVTLLHTTSDMVGEHITPIALDPSGAEHAAGSRAVLSGWGADHTGGLPVTLQRVDIPVVGQAECMAGWPAGWVTPDMICASEPGRDACGGDSGGPLVVAGHQIGIVSWGDSLCVGTAPGVFARVAFPLIRSFIESTTGV